ncbi:TPA: 23S rRNA (guanosine(2251)-2'-O)-methyltransferase RlmB [Candidatus Delongbacteria bacterium]|nr:MAG: 23S rRNA (guanosine(2251)-2'-O)-methyltransferase RlmB [Candidatus Delongbacteria bacterium GWF2_40_14]HAQ62501.1 23S rRNA (guanosine(2251)-2'-O)-methyltransferase RlmB [Candidatus Delongbacteria bacterium]
MSELITGKNAIIELLEKDPKKIEKIVIEKGYKSDKIGKILDLCNSKSVRYDILPSIAVYQAPGERSGVAAVMTPFEYTEFGDVDLFEAKNIVILDEIEDPHNFGAIVRTAAASGADLIIIPDRNAAQVTETVINVSAGTIFKIRISRVKNIASCMETLKKNGFWITGTDMDGSSNYSDYDYTDKSVIVIGNEGKGLRRLVKEKCDDVVRIDIMNGVESLNASVAAALVLFERKRKNL